MAEVTIRVLNWNLAGAKFLRSGEEARDAHRARLRVALDDLIGRYKPDFLVLQETAVFGDGDAPNSLAEPPSGYLAHSTIGIDNVRYRSPERWGPFESLWPPGTYMAQAQSLFYADSLQCLSLWSDSDTSWASDAPEVVRMETGLYAGNRDTEPRLAIVHRFRKNGFDVLIVNIHLLTMKGERQGHPRIDALGRRTRIQQIELVLHGIVSRYNEWLSGSDGEGRRPNPVWILAGDFNCVPGSPEIELVESLNFVDLNPNKGSGSKCSGLGTDPTITVDFIFAGPKYIAFDPHVISEGLKSNPAPIVDSITRGASDHYPLFAEVTLRR